MRCAKLVHALRVRRFSSAVGSLALAFVLVRAAGAQETQARVEEGWKPDSEASSSAGAQEAQARVGERAPRFFLPQLEGGDFYLRDYAGPDDEIRNRRRERPKAVVVLSFFATWCVPCRKELPELQRLSRAFEGQPVEWRLVDVGDRADSTRWFLRQLGVEMPVLMDHYRVVTQWYCTTLPTLVVIDREGVVRYLHTGYGEDDSGAMRRAAAVLSDALGVPIPAGWEIGADVSGSPGDSSASVEREVRSPGASQ